MITKSINNKIANGTKVQNISEVVEGALSVTGM